MLIYLMIRGNRQQLETEGFPMEEWTPKDLSRHVWITPSELHQLEKKGLIDRLTRDKNSRIKMAPFEVWKILRLLESYLISNVQRQNKGQEKAWPI